MTNLKWSFYSVMWHFQAFFGPFSSIPSGHPVTKSIFNSIRFPYLCFKHGGGAFLIPYFLLIITGAVPMYFLEIIMGQYARGGTIKIWDLCPVFRGVGIGITIMNMMVNVYYIVIMTWAMHFLFMSLTPLFNEDGLLPWTTCKASWNTEKCRTPEEWAANANNNDTVASSMEYWK